MATSIDDRILQLSAEILQHPVYRWRYDRSQEWLNKRSFSLLEIMVGSCEEVWHALRHWGLLQDYRCKMQEWKRLSNSRERAHL